MGAADWIAIYAAIVATGALSLEVRRWFESGPKIYLRATPNMLVINHPATEGRKFVRVLAVNRGDAPTTIQSLGVSEYQNIWARWRDKPIRAFAIPHPQLPGSPPTLPYVLKTGEQWNGFVHDRIDVTGDMETGKMYAVIYTTDREKPYIARIPKRKPNKLEGAKEI
ncbi:hypothetical protein HGP14_14730 [Rhizobium sp. P32RR-XVIII]|uniref:hypothetical protein n=1 Tax=Rhizobium sp. P32RR-XVIII TaxID=2726738 RepID=UPI0014564050|nr:hypothetical protein [Rhizobium sp. P32RR-XVIII]NLS04611.1 hypothetical protein [Rhizobium sp. P32RR-XVIII]